MGDKSRIEWTDASWNPVTGCTKVSPGCDNCYAESMANNRLRDRYLKKLPVIREEKNLADPFAVRLWPERIDQPYRWTRPRRIFVNSMSDLFHAEIPPRFLLRIWDIMVCVPHHQYQILTKRPGRAWRFWRENHQYLSEDGMIPPHIWIGTSIENKRVASHRIRILQRISAHVRFLSCEPLLGPLPNLNLEGIHWLIAGGESGTRFRPMDLDWVRDLRDQCQRARVPFFYKQRGGRYSKEGGRILDGRTWNEYPQ